MNELNNKGGWRDRLPAERRRRLREGRHRDHRRLRLYRKVRADDNAKYFVISSYYTAVYESTVGDFAVKVSLAMKIQTLSGCPSSAN